MDAEKRQRKKRIREQIDEKKQVVSSATDLNKKRKVTETTSKDITKPVAPAKTDDNGNKPWEQNA